MTASNTPSTSLTASVTPSTTATSTTGASQTPSPSGTGTGTVTPTTSATPSATATGTPSPTPTLTTMGRPLPSNAFVLMTIGDGNVQVPNLAADVLAPASFSVYTDCGMGCASPMLERTVPLYSGLATDRYGNRFWTINAGSYCLPQGADLGRCRSTFRHGRLVPSDDRSTLLSGGFDAAAGYNLNSAKREPSMLRIRGSGMYNVTLVRLAAGWGCSLACAAVSPACRRRLPTPLPTHPDASPHPL